MGSCRILVKNNSVLVQKLSRCFISGHNDIDCKRLHRTGLRTKHDLTVLRRVWLLSFSLLKG